jgi:hypothetical protein
MWSRCSNVVVEGHVFEMGTVGGRGKGNGEQKGGEVSIQPARDLSGRESHDDAKEGFQVSKEGIQEQG